MTQRIEISTGKEERKWIECIREEVTQNDTVKNGELLSDETMEKDGIKDGKRSNKKRRQNVLGEGKRKENGNGGHLGDLDKRETDEYIFLVSSTKWMEEKGIGTGKWMEKRDEMKGIRTEKWMAWDRKGTKGQSMNKKRGKETHFKYTI